MNFKSLEYFIETCKHNSFTNAAKSLFISQQALSRSIRNLEEELNCTLFTRSARGIELTESGNFLYNQFQPVIKSHKDAVGRTVAYFGNHPQKLAFCCGYGSIQNIAPEILISFAEHYPHVELDMIELSDLQCEEYIQRDRQRFGLMIAPEWIHRQKHNYLIVKKEPAYLLVHRNNPLAACSSVSLAALKKERVLALGKNSYYMKIINKAVEPYGFTVEPFFETSDVTGLCGLVDKGKGVFLCIRQIYENYALKNTVLVPVKERTADYCLAFIFQDYDALDPLAQKLILFLLKNVEKSFIENMSANNA